MKKVLEEDLERHIGFIQDIWIPKQRPAVICFKGDFSPAYWMFHIIWQLLVYVERNPVRSGMCKQAEEYSWSSARYHLGKKKSDPLIKKKYKGMARPREWSKWLESDPSNLKEFRYHFRLGRPYGGESFFKQAELRTCRSLFPQKTRETKET